MKVAIGVALVAVAGITVISLIKAKPSFSLVKGIHNIPGFNNDFDYTEPDLYGPYKVCNMELAEMYDKFDWEMSKRVVGAVA